MSASKRIAFAVAMTWASSVIRTFVRIAFVPILFRYLGQEELGLWFLLGNSQAFLQLLGMGIEPTLQRHIALAKGKSGANPNIQLNEESKRHIGDLVATGRIILQILAGVMFVVACVSGLRLIGQIDLQHISGATIAWAWVLMCGGYAVGVWVSYLNCWLVGVGYVGWDSFLITIIGVLTTLINIIAAMLGGGLVALAAISVISGIVQRFIMLKFIRWRKPELFELQGRWNSGYAQAMVKPSLYAWLTGLGAFLILSTDNYFIALFKGADSIPSYQAAAMLVSQLYAIAINFGASSSVFVSQAWQAGDLKAVHDITLRNGKLGLSIMASGSVFLLMAGKQLIDLLFGQGHFVGYGVLFVFCIMFTLEVNHVILAFSSKATEDEVYAPWAIAAGVLNIIFTWLLIKPFGVLGVAMGTMLAQMLTNNWYAVYRPLFRLKISFKRYLREVVALWVITVLACLGLTWLIQQGLNQLSINNSWTTTIATGIVCGSVFTIFSWTLILEKHQQKSIQAKITSIWLKLAPAT